MGMWKKDGEQKCKAKIKLDEAGNFMERINDHIHTLFETMCEIANIRVNIKGRATETQDAGQVILWKKFGGISQAAAINLPALDYIRRNIRLQRQTNEEIPSPVNIEDVPEPPSISTILRQWKVFQILQWTRWC